MIDFKNSAVFKLKQIELSEVEDHIRELFIEEETLLYAFKTIRDKVIFTNKRVIAINVQGFTGKKKDYSSLPYSKIQAFSVETAGTFDLDSELELWFSGLGLVKFEFSGAAPIKEIGRLLGTFLL